MKILITIQIMLMVLFLFGEVSAIDGNKYARNLLESNMFWYPIGYEKDGKPLNLEKTYQVINECATGSDSWQLNAQEMNDLIGICMMAKNYELRELNLQ